MNHDEHDDLWELLGKAKEPKASSFFATKVMHAIRKQEEPLTIWAWLRHRWVLPVTAGACAGIVALSTLDFGAKLTTSEQNGKLIQTDKSQDPLAEMVTVISESGELDNSLNDLLATEDNSVWLAADPSSLF